ncbi:MAG: leucine-rich repeat domain-containing protein [Candidatus Methanomethylophilaceae archaeon]|nr:leucine-rich repeat domain-containing protein [Candidatus Methanomethylophilaceae archaeon]
MTKNANLITGRTAVLIAAVSFAAILSLAVFAVACDDCGSDGAGGDVGTKFDFEGMKYEVTSKGPGKNYAALVKGKDGAVVIPEFAKAGVIEYKVTEIKDSAFDLCDTVSVVMPDSIRTIGHKAFFSITELNSVIMSKGLNSIGSYAFSACNSLKSIDIPEGTTSIGDYAFESCSSLDLIKIPASLSSIGYAAFTGISKSAYFTVSEGSTKYKSVDGALFNASMDTVIKGRNSDTFAIPSSVKTIACYAFAGCNFTSVTIPAGATSIGKGHSPIAFC